LRCILLVIPGCLLALAINLFRVLALTLCAAWGGQKFERMVHDPVGLLASLSIFGLIYLAAKELRLTEKGKTDRVPGPLQQK
jgi:exosortase/archaeosortase family protein